MRLDNVSGANEGLRAVSMTGYELMEYLDMRIRWIKGSLSDYTKKQAKLREDNKHTEADLISEDVSYYQGQLSVVSDIRLQMKNRIIDAMTLRQSD